MTEPTSHVEQQIQQRIAAAKARVQAAQRRRNELSAARRRGVAARHANKLRRLAEAEHLRLDDEDQDHEEVFLRSQKNPSDQADD